MAIYGNIYKNDIEETFIGSLEISFPINEDLVGDDLDLTGRKCSVNVYAKEGNIPHLHITSNKSNKIDAALMLNVASHFEHGEHKTILSKTNLKEIDKWLDEKSTNEKYKDLTNYEVCKIFWNKGPSKLKATALVKPDYTNAITYEEFKKQQKEEKKKKK